MNTKKKSLLKIAGLVVAIISIIVTIASIVMTKTGINQRINGKGNISIININQK